MQGSICESAGGSWTTDRSQQFTIIRIGVETISRRGLNEALGIAYGSILQLFCALSGCKFFPAQLDPRDLLGPGGSAGPAAALALAPLARGRAGGLFQASTTRKCAKKSLLVLSTPVTVTPIYCILPP